MNALSVSSLVFVFCPLTFGQQFQLIPDAIPGPGQNWTESVECADVDRDGDLDFFLASGGGWSSVSAVAYQHQLIINQGGLIFSDESTRRLGAHESCSKRVITGDVNGDGFEDAMFLNAFDGNPPALYVNRGATQPGHFDEEGPDRGFTEALNSYAGQFGDVDNDGDFDVVISDSTIFWAFLDGEPPIAGHPRLYLNDGNGFFAEAVAPAWAPIDHVGSHDVQLVDIDSDYDVDVLVSNVTVTAKTHYLMINDGTAHFTDVAEVIPTAASWNVWETEVADLDDDTDADLFMLGVQNGPPETFWLALNGPMENLTVGGSGLGFAALPTSGGSDINEVVLLDYDVDGDLDAFVATLGVPVDQVHRNLGGLQFEIEDGVIAPGLDIQKPTLDAAAADLDGDGDYDYLTVQGEYPVTDWTDTLFVNTGPKDSLAPVVLHWEELAIGQPKSGPWVVRAAVRDQVLDDGKDWVVAAARYAVTTAEGKVIRGTARGLDAASGLKRVEMSDLAAGSGVLLTYQLLFIDGAGNRTSTPRRTVTLR